MWIPTKKCFKAVLGCGFQSSNLRTYFSCHFLLKRSYNKLMIKNKHFDKLKQFIKTMLYEFRRFLKIIIVMFLGVLIGGFLLLILSNIAVGTTRWYLKILNSNCKSMLCVIHDIKYFNWKKYKIVLRLHHGKIVSSYYYRCRKSK